MKEKLEMIDTIISDEVLNNGIIESIQELKGSNIILMDLSHVEDSPTDYFIICDAESTVKCRAIANRIKENIKNSFNYRPNHIEGITNGQWILVDYLSTIVHIFYKDLRSYYDLEELWQDAKIKEFENL